MRSVLGIDAAWTEHEPSGIALIADNGSGWRLIDVAASYEAFMRPVPDAGPILRHRGSVPDAAAIIEAANATAGTPVDIVAVDMPLAMTPIVGRRVSDNLISAAYGSRHASTHTPSVTRPGKLSDDLRTEFEDAGYRLAVSNPVGRALLEIYPHPALIELAAAERRLPYKASKISKYWPKAPPGARKANLLEAWRQIMSLLETQIIGVVAALPLPPVTARGYEMKAFEDSLDAVVCAWVGACVLDGRARAFGDEVSAIWVPNGISSGIK
jgi:predicted RNase H-like nuclease